MKINSIRTYCQMKQQKNSEMQYIVPMYRQAAVEIPFKTIKNNNSNAMFIQHNLYMPMQFAESSVGHKQRRNSLSRSVGTVCETPLLHFCIRC